MLRSYWSAHRDVIRWLAVSGAILTGSVVLYAMGVSVGSGMGYHEAQSDGYAAQYPSDTDKRVSECFANSDLSRAKECAQSAIEASRESQRSEGDLSAQRDMSEWAFWLLGLTAVQSLLGFGGFVALVITIRQGRDANAISRNVAAADLRPYLFIDRLRLIDAVDQNVEPTDENSGEEVPGFLFSKIEIYLKNFGKVPARNIRVVKKEFYGRIYAGRFFRYNLSHVTIGVCAPGHERRVFGHLMIPGKERADFDNGGLHYLIRLRFTFEDEAGTTFTEKAAYSFSGDDLETFYLLGDLNIAAARKRRDEIEFDFSDDGEIEQ